MTVRAAARALFAILLVLVSYLTVTPNPEDVETGMGIARWLAAALFGDAGLGDKLAHFLAYAALGASAALARLRVAGRAAVAVFALALYGAALECVQAFVAPRDADIADAAANALGAAAGYAGAGLLIGFAARGRLP